MAENFKVGLHCLSAGNRFYFHIHLIVRFKLRARILRQIEQLFVHTRRELLVARRIHAAKQLKILHFLRFESRSSFNEIHSYDEGTRLHTTHFSTPKQQHKARRERIKMAGTVCMMNFRNLFFFVGRVVPSWRLAEHSSFPIDRQLHSIDDETRTRRLLLNWIDIIKSEAATFSCREPFDLIFFVYF